MKIYIPIAPGELIDRLTILAIKLERLSDKNKIANVRYEYELLMEQREKLGSGNASLEALEKQLGDVNREIWDIEDCIRDLERSRDFGEKFVAVARSVYQTNDKRAELKRHINLLLKSELIEEKSYSAY